MNKKNLSESDICDKFIRPAIEAAGWNGFDQIYREYPNKPASSPAWPTCAACAPI